MDRRSALAASLAALAALRAQHVAAQAGADWPTHPVKLIVPFAPGGPTDTVARLLAERLQSMWKQSVVVDYKPGGGTVLGTQNVASAPTDGYTLGMAISALTLAVLAALCLAGRDTVVGVEELPVPPTRH